MIRPIPLKATCPCFLLFALLSAGLAHAEQAAPPDAAVQAAPSPGAQSPWMFELDPYYSSVAYEIPLTDTPEADGAELPESRVYTRLWRQSLSPQILMFEASVYPLPVLGSWLYSASPRTYHRFDLTSSEGRNLNLVEAVTAGFQEPWAVSVFLGSAMNFQKPGDRAPNNRGYMGYLLSYGAQHIVHNRMVQDRWWELEWKLKGEQRKNKDFLSWSFRLGLKEHGNPDIADLFYIGLRRSSLRFDAPVLDWLNNSSLEWRTEFDRRDLRFLRQEMSIGYKLPFKAYGLALGLELGLIVEEGAKYRGDLADPQAGRYTVILRPRIDF